jgi:Txe/YoeB family toxin of Txe-Axe toxin-antitoxin module
MWIFLNNAFLSIVEPSQLDPEANAGRRLLVRARVSGHIETLFSHAEAREVPGRDYQFRAYIDRDIVAHAIAESIRNIQYGNFKGSVKNEKLHDAYACVWGVMAQEQEIPPYEKTPRKRKRFAVNPRSPYSNNPS